MRFKSRPVEIEAIQFTGNNVDEVLELMQDKPEPHLLYFKLEGAGYWDDPEIIANIYDELHGMWIGVRAGEWIVREINGEFCLYDSEIFAQKYELIKE